MLLELFVGVSRRRFRYALRSCVPLHSIVSIDTSLYHCRQFLKSPFYAFDIGFLQRQLDLSALVWITIGGLFLRTCLKGKWEQLTNLKMLAMGYNLYSNSISCDQRSWVEFLVVNTIASVRSASLAPGSRLLSVPGDHIDGTIEVPVTGLGAAFIDKAGRKPLLLAEELRKSLWAKNVSAKVYLGMRYWHPFTEEAIEQNGKKMKKLPGILQIKQQ
ncbi:ferrochelatase-2, chloroplastic [Senna tora]|uniref:Ferrochelatase-2, chloroplastic n=1 Tax=Senna tora TaxID=362788 RepID=A0A835C5W9_9FABA|nr:ferrochelatase-2, chloroplastic [Senna tora]